jgi:hypothetical protein
MSENEQADDREVLVYSGSETEAAFLVSLLGGSGIDASLNYDTRGGGTEVFVAIRDRERALPIVEDFDKNGTKT